MVFTLGFVSVCILVPVLLRFILLGQTAAYYTTNGHKLDSLLMDPKASKAPNVAYNQASNSASIPAADISKASLHPFNPNTATEAELISLGIPPYLAQRIGKYRNAGGQFRKPPDLKRIYSFPPPLYSQLEPYILLPASQTASQLPKPVASYSKSDPYKASNRQVVTAPKVKIDLNEADSAMLEALPGIGSFTAHGIISYRRLLGGFVHLHQLYEVFGQDYARTQAFLSYLFISPSFQPRKVPINQMGADYKVWHPYIPKLNAKLIRAYIKAHPPFHDSSELVARNLLTQPEVDRLLPYLSFQ